MPHVLERQIGRTRRQARRLLARYGMSWTLASLLAVVIVLGLADYLLRFEDRGIRLMCSLAVAAVSAAVAYRFWIAPLSRRLSDVEVSQRLERRFPQLGERLSSAIEFLRRAEGDPGAGSPTLRRRVMHDTEVAMADLDLDEALDPRPARSALAAAGCAAVLALALIACSPRSAWLAAARLAKPFGSERWPRQNNLEFRSAPARLAVGESFDAELVDTDGRLPDEVRVVYRYDSDGGHLENVETFHPQGDQIAIHQERIERPFSYRAEGGDDHQMEWRSVDVIETPRVESFTVRLAPPAYTGWPAGTSDGQIQALRGTRMEFSGAATKRLAAVAWRQGDRLCPGVVAPDGLAFRVPAPGGELLIDGSGPYSFELTDGEGLVGGKADHWEIRAIADQGPGVTIELPAGNSFVTAAAVVPIKVAAKDDLALRDVALRAIRSDRSDEGEIKIELYRGPERVPPGAAGEAGAAGGGDGEGGESRTVETAWPLAALQLKPGAEVTFFAVASDYLPQYGQSPPRKLTIISPQELEDRVAQRQNLILTELARALKMQQEARSQITSLEIQIREVGRLAKADLDRAQAAELNQRQVAKVLAGENDGIPAQIRELFADLENNRVDSPDLKRRMQDMLDEIGRLNDDHLGPIERELTSAVKEARSELQDAPPADAKQESAEAKTAPGAAPASPAGKSLTAAGRHQDQVVEALESMFGRLSRWDNYRRFAREVAQLHQQWDEQSAGTREAAAKTLAKDLKDLDPQQQADLKKLAARQHDLARHLDKLEQQMDETRQRLADEDPLAAETLGDALEQARRRAVSGQMRQAGDEAQRNQVSQSLAAQQKVSQELEELQNILSNRREQELDRLVRKLREAERDLEKLRKRQAGLHEKMSAAAKRATVGKTAAEDAERKRELERLTRQARELQEDSQRMARRLQRLQAERAGRKMAGAAGRMGRSGQAEEQGDDDGAELAAAQAEHDLDEAQQQLAQRRRQAEADLAQEQIARIEDSIKNLRERQGQVRAETIRYAELMEAKGRLTRGQASSVQELARQEQALAAETQALADKIAAAEVFHLVLSGAADDMRHAAELLAGRDTGAATRAAEQSAEQRLERVVAALDPSKKPGKGNNGADGDQGGGGGGEGGAQGNGNQDGIRSIAEFKLLKLMQEDLRDRFKSAVSDQGQSPAARAELLERLAAEQGRLAELTFKLSQPIEENPEDTPEKLPDVRGPTPDGADAGAPRDAPSPAASSPPDTDSPPGDAPSPKAPAGDVPPIEIE